MKDNNHYLINDRLLDKINSDEELAASYYFEETPLDGCLVDEDIKQLISFSQTYVN
jgi:hypothetical protein